MQRIMGVGSRVAERLMDISRPMGRVFNFGNATMSTNWIFCNLLDPRVDSSVPFLCGQPAPVIVTPLEDEICTSRSLQNLEFLLSSFPPLPLDRPLFPVILHGPCCSAYRSAHQPESDFPWQLKRLSLRAHNCLERYKVCLAQCEERKVCMHR